MSRRERAEGVFQPGQIQQFREAFHLLDHDKDGSITENDLHHTFTSLGISPSRPLLDALLDARPGPSPTRSSHPAINFTMFLTMMSERLSEFDPVPDLTDAFESFDETDTGVVNADEIRKWLADVGDRMDQQEIDKLLDGPFTDRHGNFNYREWIKVLRVDDDAEQSEPVS